MSILANPLRIIFFFYLFYLYYSYVRPISIDSSAIIDSSVREVAIIITDYGIHFIAFFILGSLAQLANNKFNDFIFGISLALITSVFIEFIHIFIPFRDFIFFEGIANIAGCVTAIYLISYLKSKYG